MNVYLVNYKEGDWCDYIIAPTRTKAKLFFYYEWKWTYEPDYAWTDIRCRKVKTTDIDRECSLSNDPDGNKIMAALGLKFTDPDED